MKSLDELLPHRGRMRLLDSIVELTNETIVAERRIRPDDFFLEGHYPDRPILPGVITCECLFQAGAALMGHRTGESGEGPIPVVAGIDKARFREPIFPGDLVELRVRLREEVGGMAFLSGEARVNGRRKATVDFTCARMPAP